jgi:hypothetical protein
MTFNDSLLANCAWHYTVLESPGPIACAVQQLDVLYQSAVLSQSPLGRAGYLERREMNRDFWGALMVEFAQFKKGKEK